MTLPHRDVRYYPESGHCRAIVRCPLCATSRHLLTQEVKSLLGTVTGTRQRRAAIFGLADLSSQFACDDVSTFRKAQKHSRETPKESSTLLPPNLATRVTFLLRAGQTFQQATQVQTATLCPNQGWPRHKLGKLANTRQNPAWFSLAYDAVMCAVVESPREPLLKRVAVVPKRHSARLYRASCNR
jgi:hypothetical protein